jgi:hypothetical protein
MSNDFLPFATAFGANVESQATFAADGSTLVGFASGVALSAKFNKVWRQSSFSAAAFWGWVVDYSALNANDDGNLTYAIANIDAAMSAKIVANQGGKYVYAGNPNGNVAGVQGTPGGRFADLCEDSTTGHIYACTVTGNAASAVWVLASSGGVTSVATGSGLTGGPITTTGTISAVTATNSVLGVVKPDGVTITIAAGVLTSINAGGNVVGPGSGNSTVGDFAVWNNTNGSLLKDVPAATTSQIWTGTDNGSPLTSLGINGAQAFQTQAYSGSITINFNLGINWTVTLGGNPTINAPSNVKDGTAFTIEFAQPASGGPYTPTLASWFKFPTGVSPTWSTAANARDTLTGIYKAGAGYAVCNLSTGI